MFIRYILTRPARKVNPQKVHKNNQTSRGYQIYEINILGIVTKWKIERSYKKTVLDTAEKPKRKARIIMGDLVIDVSGLRKVYRIGQEKVIALDHVDMQVERGTVCCLLGTSGSGKSTLLNMLAGLEKPTKGTITIDGNRIDRMNEKALAKYRQGNVGFVFQSYNLIPSMTALENVALPLTFEGVPRKKRIKIAKDMLTGMGLGDHLNHRPTQLSGGQQQRVGIARAFVASPKIVYADEPTGNLDSKTTSEIMELIVRETRKNRGTLVLVTHDHDLSKYADKVFHVLDGNILSIVQNEQPLLEAAN